MVSGAGYDTSALFDPGQRRTHWLWTNSDGPFLSISVESIYLARMGSASWNTVKSLFFFHQPNLFSHKKLPHSYNML